MTSRACHRQEPQGVASAWQPDTLLSDVFVMSNLTFEPSLIYIIKDLLWPIYSMVVIFEKLFFLLWFTSEVSVADVY